MRAKRILAIVICGVYIAALLVSGVFVYTHAEHNCAGNDCAICAAISSCERLLRAFAAFLIALGLAMFFEAALRARYHIARPDNRPVTPVSLKVKLTN